MNIVNRQGLYINKLRKNKVLIALPIYKDINKFEIVYRLKLCDYKKRNRQKANNKRPYSWIYIHDSDIAKALNINKNIFNTIMKQESKALYSRGEGFYFKTKEDCLYAINRMYDNLKKIRR